MISHKTIFISPIDWGLGHATRCVPIIRKLKETNKVIIGTTPLTENIFNLEFPELEKINMPAYNIRYSSILPLWLKLFFSSPRIFSVIGKEHKLIQKIIEQNKIDVVISDNRFGLFSKKVHSIFITHQVFLKTPFANKLAQKINKYYIQKFAELWIPDYESDTENLSGALSHGKYFHSNVKYIGPQSRLEKKEDSIIKYDYLILLSGPEPQYSILKNLLLKKAGEFPHKKIAFAMHARSNELENIPFHVNVFYTFDKDSVSKLIAESETIICRSGYSTLMDLHLLNKKKLLLIPTPGQTEQEYLAVHWQKNFGSKNYLQKEIKNLEL